MTTTYDTAEIVRQYRDAWREAIERSDGEASLRDNYDGSDSYLAGFDAVMDFVQSLPGTRARFASYPFLEIARTNGVSYGHVLSYADLAARPNEPLTCWQKDAVAALPGRVRTQIIDTLRRLADAAA